MRLSTLLVTVLLTLACGGGAALAPAGPVTDMATRFETFDCSPGSTDPDRSWCPVASAGHGPLSLPGSTEIRAGLTLALQPGQDPRDVVLDTTTLSALYLGPDGAKITGITPSNDEEMMDMVGVVMSIASTLKGVEYSSVLAKSDLIAYLESQATGLYPVTLDEHGGTFQGSVALSHIQRIEGERWGWAYVVIEEFPGGTHVSVFPDSDRKALPE